VKVVMGSEGGGWSVKNGVFQCWLCWVWLVQTSTFPLFELCDLLVV